MLCSSRFCDSRCQTGQEGIISAEQLCKPPPLWHVPEVRRSLAMGAAGPWHETGRGGDESRPPKWKMFRGPKLLQRDKIQLNNAIWRAQYLQYVEERRNPACNFVTLLEARDRQEHSGLEVGTVEGKYWKHHIQAVTREYHKWRMYSCAQVRKMKDKPAALPSRVRAPCLHPCSLSEGLPSPSLASPTGSPSSAGFWIWAHQHLSPFLCLARGAWCPAGSGGQWQVGGQLPHGTPCHPAAHQGNADVIQPTLGQLHPNFGEDFMDALHSPCGVVLGAARGPSPLPSACCGASLVPSCVPSLPRLLWGASLKEEPPGAKEVLPLTLPLELEPRVPPGGQQTFLPLFPTSPLWVSPPACPPGPASPTPSRPRVLHRHCQNTGTFTVPAPVPPPKGATHQRSLQLIAPTPRATLPPVCPAAAMHAAHLPPGWCPWGTGGGTPRDGDVLTAVPPGLAALPVVPARNRPPE
ncbi:LOW QUALITY PROTEIN: MLX-interacting protein-like [Morphnus guianensis]